MIFWLHIPAILLMLLGLGAVGIAAQEAVRSFKRQSDINRRVSAIIANEDLIE